MSKINCVIVVTNSMHYGGQAVTVCSIDEQLTSTHTHTLVRSLKYYNATAFATSRQ